MPKQKLHYCLTCGRIVSLFPGTVEWHFGDFEQRSEEDYGPAQCYGPFTNSTPPQLPDNWNEILTDPSAEELEVMDENAGLLLFDLGVM